MSLLIKMIEKLRHITISELVMLVASTITFIMILIEPLQSELLDLHFKHIYNNFPFDSAEPGSWLALFFAFLMAFAIPFLMLNGLKNSQFKDKNLQIVIIITLTYLIIWWILSVL